MGELMLDEIAVQVEGEENWTYLCEGCEGDMIEEL
jgi:hypothetical protein